MAFKPNRDLLNVNFEGYKLSLSPITCLSCAIQGEVHAATLKEGAFSYHHVRAFSLHNHLTPDPYDESSVYWCNKDGSIQRGTYAGTTSAELTVKLVYSGDSVPDICNNLSLVLVSPQLALHSSGREMSLLHTGRREEGRKWELIKTYTLSESSSVSITRATITDDSSIQLLITELQIPSSTTASDERVKDNIVKCTWYKIKFKSSIETIQHSAAIVRDSLESITEITSFHSKSLPLYTAFQSHPTHSTQYLLFMSETTPTLPSKTTPKDCDIHPSASPPPAEDANVDTQSHFGLGYSTDKYEWSQTDSEVVVRFEVPKGVTKREIYCVISRQELVVGLTDGTTFLRGELHDIIDTEGSTWTIENGTLEVTLDKSQCGVQWPRLKRGEEGVVTRPEVNSESSGKTSAPPEAKRPRPLVSCEQEECDTADEEATLYLVSQDGALVNKASLSGRQLVFTAPSQPDHAHYFITRHDVDAIVWIPSSTTLEEPSWTHVNTFNALGYVQASKENRKFTTSPPNLKFAVITDCTRHIFVYIQPEEGVMGNKAREFVYTLSEKMDILGLTASNSGLVFVLTPRTLFALKLPL
ncbi:nudC domain-containing protein 1-like [Halichondria panicea]|uniref:nudC domain-containing protein 1-like n=1 Tax=Halichondria panicea TaxID=6063 RepID=UPI00312B8E64